MVTSGSSEYSFDEISEMSSDEDEPGEETKFDHELLKTRINTVSYKNLKYEPVGLSNQRVLAKQLLTALGKFENMPANEVNELLDGMTSEVIQVVRKALTRRRSYDREQINKLLKDRMEERVNGKINIAVY